MPSTIMIVDDDEQILTLVEILLRRQGYQVVKAPSPYVALDLLDISVPDLILLDFMMPGINGIELCHRIRMHPKGGKVPVVMLSAVASEEFIRESLKAGASGHIPKSEMHRRLLHEVAQYLPAVQSR